MPGTGGSGPGAQGKGVTKLSYGLDKSLNHYFRLGLLVGLGACLLPGCFILHRHRNKELAGPVNPGDQPDKILYEKAVNEIQHGRYDVGRLTLQTLMNTYPDSEYLAKAKLAIADSYYREGGISGLTQAETEYRDFITFFPTAPEAPDAQFKIGMAHFHLMGKPDRDRQEALLAEAEFKEFLLKYPDSPLMPRAKARLREVQEVLGQGDYRIAQFYYMKGALRAARSRYQEIVDQYPGFSKADGATWYLAQTLERLRQPTQAASYYGRLVSDYPLSSRVDDAKSRLTALHQPIPKPTKAILARARADAIRRRKPDLLARLGGIMSSAPDLTATRHGPVILGSPKPTETEASRGTAPAPGGNTIAVQTVNDASLNSGKPVDPKTGDQPGNSNSGGTATQDGGAAKQAGDNAQATAAPTSGAGPSADDVQPPRKKKGKFHFLKKLLP